MRQRQAVEHDTGPLLVIAGAGSGKTRILVYRIAWLLTQNLATPQSILAVTFTNEAADEILSRLQVLLGDQANGLTVGTFHAVCFRVLQNHAEELGYKGSSLTVYDEAAAGHVLNEALRQSGVDERWEPDVVRQAISQAKDYLRGPEEFVTVPGDFNQVEIQKVYYAYQDILRQRGALDFDDLIFQTVRLLQGNPDSLAFYQDAWRYVLVDEFQDTSHGQCRLVELLARKHRNLCAIGSPAQGIYGWRGAEIKNILQNLRRASRGEGLVLDQNYRSSKTIVAAAQAVARSMADYQRYRDHALWTANPQGQPIFYRRFASDRDEAAFVSAEIRRLTFWSDPVVRHVVAWLRAAHNPDDPAEVRGAAVSDDLGPLLVERLEAAGCPLTYEGLAQVLGEAGFLDEQEQGMVVAFLGKIDRLVASAQQGDAGDLVAAIAAEKQEQEVWSEPASQQNLAELRAKARRESVAVFLQGVIPLVESAPRLDDVAVLYRTNAQSRPVERCLLDAGIPYQMGGRSRFFERVEVRDMLSYLRLAQNPEDVEALRCTINRPPRGLGPKTLEKMQGQEPNLSMDLIAHAIGNEALPEKARRALEEYYLLIMDLERDHDQALPDLLDLLVDRTGYREYLLGEGGGQERLENIQELRAMATRHGGQGVQAIGDFLAQMALLASEDPIGPIGKGDGHRGVQLSTIHSVKGLEFAVVFLVGLDEGIFPHVKAKGSYSRMQEERRLFYVAVTRARQQLYLLSAAAREVYGEVRAVALFILEEILGVW